MKNIITITSKGQTTLPVAARRKLGLTSAGGVLRVRFNKQQNELIISKPLDIHELGTRISRHIKPGIKPLSDVDAYYQRQRAMDV
ncbi:hypothetical protein COY17_03570 [Candidatus Saccharibacteria bacterium CG_4_10_14_0_2_um_filter_52_9]|nr:MAG: hypothetical protein COY17_03570 [Candidatus Saccharibacteria bacterium CG_4_10_14_0_2_um_filter_52_9]